jgi:choline dehydrogenase-like flavoprotein
VALAEERFRRAGLGTFEFGRDPPDLETMTDAAHQMGTTRMSSSPEGGGVDPDRRAWGTTNLYVASSSVRFLAVAHGLGEHLLGGAGQRA